MFRKTTFIFLLIIFSMALIACDSKPKEETSTQTSNKKVAKKVKKKSNYTDEINKALSDNVVSGCIRVARLSELPYTMYKDDIDTFEKIGFTFIKKEREYESFGKIKNIREYDITEKGKEFFKEDGFCFKATDIKVNKIINVEKTKNWQGEDLTKITFTYKLENTQDWLYSPEIQENITVKKLINAEKDVKYVATKLFRDGEWQVVLERAIP